MRGPLSTWFLDDHRRLEALLNRSAVDPGRLDLEAYETFRGGLLRHIALEEKFLLPAVRRAHSGTPHPLARRLRVDHGANSSHLVPTPNVEIVAELRSVLDPHNAVEEGEGGLYEGCDEQPAAEAMALLEGIQDYPAVEMAPHRDGRGVYRTGEDALRASARQGDGTTQSPTGR